MKRKIIILSSILIVISLTIIIGFNIFHKEDRNKEIKIDITTLTKSTIIKDNIVTTTKSTNVKNEKEKTISKTTNTSKKNNIINTTKNSKTTTVSSTEIVEIVSVNDEFVENNVEYKYGVKITKLDKVRTVLYSDGSSSVKTIDTKTEYDHKGYNATTNDLKVEGINVRNKNSSIYDEMLNYVNQYRSEVGKNSLVIDNELNYASTIRAIEMAWADKLSHTRPNNTDCFTVYQDLSISYNFAGENIALGYTNVASVSDGWKNSQGHYENMINDNFTYAGFGKYELNGKIYWVQMFK